MNQPFAPFVPCTKCRAVLPEDLFNRPDLAACPSCGAPTQVRVFPAFFREITAGESGVSVLSDTESSCFYHPQKRAVTPCEGCGRFLCALCDVDFNGQHLCPSCLETGRTKGRIKNLQNERVCHDNVALFLAILPLLMCLTLALAPIAVFFSLATAPIAVFLSIRHWNSPCSIIPRSKIRFVAALLFASLQIVGWAALVYFIFRD